MFEDVFKKITNRKTDSNKYDFGHVLVFGGAPGMVGAPMLCAMGALRIGAGLVTIASSAQVIDKLEKRVLEIMTLQVPSHTKEQIQVFEEYISKRRVSVLVAGPGFDEKHVEVLKELLPRMQIPVVLDALALTCFSNCRDKLSSAKAPIAITPHSGELKTFSGAALSDEITVRMEQVKAIAESNNLVLVAKGSPTIVCSKSGDVYINETGNPGLSTAGTGDVLAGIIAGLIAQGVDVGLSSKAGTYIHGLAGDLADKDKTQASVIASDLFDFLPNAIKESIS